MRTGPHYGGRPRLEPGKKATPLGIALSATQLERLEPLLHNGQTRAAIIRAALDEYLDRHCPRTEEDDVA